MHKFKLFIENFFVYGLGGVISKIIPLIMVPIITRLMPDTTYFGINDLIGTVSSFAGAIAILGMYDGMYRMFFEKDDLMFQRRVCSSTFIFTSCTTVLVCIVLLISGDWIAEFVFGDIKYSYLVYISILSTFVSATNAIVSAPSRMQNQRKIFLMTNILSSVFSYAISIPLLLKGYYMIAVPVAGVISASILELFFVFYNKKWFHISLFDVGILKDTLKIALPLFPNFIVYWVFNSCDRLMISRMLSVADVGIYSIGGKLGHLSQLISTAFGGGWLYFSFSTMKENNQVKNNSLIFEYMGIITYSTVAVICSISYFVYKLFFVGDYVLGYQVAPYLFFSPLVQMLFQIVVNQFIIIKKTWPNLILLSVGAIVNIFINLWLIPILGVEGAAIATLIGYIITLTLTIIVLNRLKLAEISHRFYIATVIMTLFLLIWRLFLRESTVISIILSVILIFTFIMLYKRDLMSLWSNIKASRSNSD